MRRPPGHLLMEEDVPTQALLTPGKCKKAINPTQLLISFLSAMEVVKGAARASYPREKLQEIAF